VLFVGFSLIAALVVFLYPLEIETRESAIWLHVLALKQGINLYDHSQVAFVETHKGPIDPLLKLGIATLFPFLESWQITRFIPLLLPCAFGLVTWKLTQPSSARYSPWRIPYLSSVGYLLLLLTAKEFLYVGRPDATAALLFLGFVFLSIAPSPVSRRGVILHGLLCGVTGMLVILTHWRIAPCVVAVFSFSLWQDWQICKKRVPELCLYLSIWAIAAFSLWLIVFFTLFDGNWSLYHAHTFGLFSADSGWGTTASGRGSAVQFALGVFNPYADPSALKGSPLLMAIAVYLLTPSKENRLRIAWFTLGGMVFAANAIPYYLNYNGGGAWYFIPFIILVWIYCILHVSQLPPLNLTLLGVMVLLLMIVNYRSLLLPTIHRIATMEEAGQFMGRLRSLQQQHTMLSEDTFLFRTTYQGDAIDSGDEVLAVFKTGYYGSAFGQTVQQHLDKLQQNPPDYIVTGFTPSAELEDVMEENYVLAETAPQNFTANANESLRLLRRKNLG
jgi:hypothetical protein